MAIDIKAPLSKAPVGLIVIALSNGSTTPLQMELESNIDLIRDLANLMREQLDE